MTMNLQTGRRRARWATRALVALGSGEHSGYHRSGLLRQCIAEYRPDHHSRRARVDTEHEHGHRPFGVGGFRCCPHAVRWLMSTASRRRCAAHPADRSVSAATQSG